MVEYIQVGRNRWEVVAKTHVVGEIVKDQELGQWMFFPDQEGAAWPKWVIDSISNKISELQEEEE